MSKDVKAAPQRRPDVDNEGGSLGEKTRGRRQVRAHAEALARREAIIAAATSLFLAAGYDINMDEVAAKAGVSKRTLYNYFRSKLALLDAVVTRNGERFIGEMRSRESSDLRTMLTHYATLFEAEAFREEGLQLFKLMVSDVSKYPDMASSMYESGINRVVSALTSQLDALRAQNALADIDTRIAAEQFIGALTGLVRHRVYAGMGLDTPDLRNKHIQQAVELFVAGLSAPRQP